MELLTRNNFEDWMRKLTERLDRQDELLLSMQPSVKAPNPMDGIRLFDNQAMANAWCGWSLRDAATGTVASGVIAQRAQQRLVAQGVDAGHHPPAALDDRQAWRRRLRRPGRAAQTHP